MYFKENLSIVYHELLEDLGELVIPDEEWIDCMDCHTCVNPNLKRFNTKCCDYQASITNFIAGNILTDSSNELAIGKQLIQKRIDERLGITPFGILPTGNYNKAFQHSRDEPSLTTQESTTALRCCFNKAGNCTIYKYRSDICGLHHCNSISVDYGANFWKEAKKTNFYLDKTLSLFIAKKMGIPLPPQIPKKLKLLSSMIETETGELDETKYKMVWGDWYTKEANYYRECAALFKSISKKELKSALGPVFEKQEASLLSLAVAFNSQRVPDYLIFKESKWNKTNKDDKLSPLILKYLRLFDGNVKTSVVVKKAAYMQLHLGETIQDLLKNGFLISSK